MSIVLAKLTDEELAKHRDGLEQLLETSYTLPDAGTVTLRLEQRLQMDWHLVQAELARRVEDVRAQLSTADRTQHVLAVLEKAKDRYQKERVGGSYKEAYHRLTQLILSGEIDAS